MPDTRKLAPSKAMVAALVLGLFAVLAIVEAHFGEWRMMHWEFPQEFPNNPDSDHGFRLSMLYWITHGQWCVLSAGLFWILSLLFFLVAVARHRSPQGWLGWSCIGLYGLLACYFAWLFLLPHDNPA